MVEIRKLVHAITQKEFDAAIKSSIILIRNVEAIEEKGLSSLYSCDSEIMLQANAYVRYYNLHVAKWKCGVEYIENLLNECKYKIPLRILVLIMDYAIEENENQIYLVLLKYKEKHYSDEVIIKLEL